MSAKRPTAPATADTVLAKVLGVLAAHSYESTVPLAVQLANVVEAQGMPRPTIGTDATPNVREFTQDFVLNVDLFNPAYCGYWLRGYDDTKDGRVLAVEFEDVGPTSIAKLDAEAEQIHKRLKRNPDAKLPKGWHLISRETGARAYAEGVAKWGRDWYLEGDATRYDVCVQIALLGEVKYG